VITLRDVWYKYGEVIGIREVNVEFDTGINFVIGPNGSGKTTLLKVASTIYKPYRGKIMIDNKDPWENQELRKTLRRNIVYVHENPILLRGTVLDNLMLPLIYRGLDEDDAKREALEILDVFGLRHLADKKRGKLSAGQKQMVSLLRSFVLKPKYLLLDEPTNSLDLDNRKKVIHYIINNMREATVIIATHDLLLPLELKGRIFRMNEGSVVEELDAKKFAERYVSVRWWMNDQPQ